MDPLLAFWNALITDRKPASSASVPHVVKVRASPPPLAWPSEPPPVVKPPQPARTSGVAAAPAAVARNCRLDSVMSGLLGSASHPREQRDGT